MSSSSSVVVPNVRVAFIWRALAAFSRWCLRSAASCLREALRAAMPSALRIFSSALLAAWSILAWALVSMRMRTMSSFSLSFCRRCDWAAAWAARSPSAACCRRLCSCSTSSGVFCRRALSLSWIWGGALGLSTHARAVISMTNGFPSASTSISALKGTGAGSSARVALACVRADSSSCRASIAIGSDASDAFCMGEPAGVSVRSSGGAFSGDSRRRRRTCSARSFSRWRRSCCCCSFAVRSASAAACCRWVFSPIASIAPVRLSRTLSARSRSRCELRARCSSRRARAASAAASFFFDSSMISSTLLRERELSLLCSGLSLGGASRSLVGEAGMSSLVPNMDHGRSMTMSSAGDDVPAELRSVTPSAGRFILRCRTSSARSASRFSRSACCCSLACRSASAAACLRCVVSPMSVRCWSRFARTAASCSRSRWLCSCCLAALAAIAASAACCRRLADSRRSSTDFFERELSLLCMLWLLSESGPSVHELQGSAMIMLSSASMARRPRLRWPKSKNQSCRSPERLKQEAEQEILDRILDRCRGAAVCMCTQHVLCI